MQSTSFIFEAWRQDLLVFDADTKEPLGFYVPHTDRAYIHEELSPEQVVNLHAFESLQNIPFFGIIGHGMQAWLDAGIDIHSALNWRDVSKNVDFVMPWIQAGFEPTEASHWIKTLIGPHRTARVAKSLKEVHFTPEDVKRWRQYNKIQSRDIPAWVQAGFEDPKAAKLWHEAKLTAAEAQLWRDRGVVPRDAAHWIQLGLPYAEIQQWQAQGMNALATETWLSINIKDPVQAKAWLDSNLEVREVSFWHEAGYTAQEALEFKHKGVKRPPQKD